MNKKLKFLDSKLAMFLLALISVGVYVYAALALTRVYPFGSGFLTASPFAVLLCISVFVTAALTDKSKREGKKENLLPSIIVLFLYNVILWGITLTTDFTLGWQKEDAISFGIVFSSILFAVFSISFFVSLLGKKRLTKIASAFLVLSFVISSAITTLVFFLKDENYNRRNIKKASSSDTAFGKITAQQLSISKNEKKMCKDWYSEKIINAGKDGKPPAYNFSVDGVTLRDSLDDWSFSVGETSTAGAYVPGGKTTFITLTNKKLKLTATVKATIYEALATCEWTVFIKNNRDENSGEISHFYALDELFSAENDTSIYYSTGAGGKGDDFSVKKAEFSKASSLHFTSTKSKNTVNYLPYFNICANQGIVFSIGWTGQWMASCQLIGTSLYLKAGQENFKAYLTANEEVRSPLISLCFYEGKNALKGFNILRKWQLSLAPDTSKPLSFYELIDSQQTAIKTENIESMKKLSNFNALWIGPEWYKPINGKWHNSTGNWSTEAADKHIFPDGLKEISGFAKAKGLALSLWYEPERVTKSSELYKVGAQNEKWLLKGADYLWNLANEDAFRYLSAYISTSIKDIGVDIYHHDFNDNAFYYWQWGDENFYDGRQGITENHYVTNLYAYWDYLSQMNYGLLIDSCDVYGNRLDIETARRTVTLTRPSSMAGANENQSAVSGISLFSPASGNKLDINNEYTARSFMTALNNAAAFDEESVKIYDDANKLRKSLYKHYFQNYFPLTPQSNGSNEWLAMQFGGKKNGFAVVYKREDVKKDEFILIMNGLSDGKSYTLHDYDNPKKPLGTFTGKQLMSGGVKLKISDAPKSMIVLYKVK